jgi:hypothetical protein
MTKKMKPTKILLINFDSKTATNVEKLTGIEVVRGYLSDHNSHTTDRRGNTKPFIQFSFPTPPYECSMVFINLNNYDASRQDFSKKIKMWSETETNNMYRFWSFNSTLLVFFVGNTQANKMLPIGVPLDLVTSSGVDQQTRIVFDEENNHFPLIEEVDGQLAMPNSKYLKAAGSDTDYYRWGTKFYPLIQNANGDTIAAALTKSRSDYDMQNPGTIILPLVKKPSNTISRLIKYFAQHYKIELTDQDWLNSSVFYPKNEINKLESEIEEVRKDASKKIDANREEISKIKSSFSYLKDLLTDEGDVLEEAAYKTLTELFKLKVSKSDEINKSCPKEDLLVEFEKNKILIEVKGTKRQNPSLKFPQQAVQHALRQGLKGVVSTGLILNHDRETDPKNRTTPYSDEESKELITDIYFIDVRVLHAMAIDILDGKLKPEKASDLLFKNIGRVVYP